MIVPIIIVLTLLLVALLVDWPGIAKKFPGLKKRANRTPKVPVTQQTKPIRVSQPQAMEDSMMVDTTGNGTPEEPEKISNNPEVQQLLEKADVFFRKGELKAAEEYYVQAAAKDPRCSKAYSRLGVIYLENGEDWQDAEAAFRQALKTDANNGYILNNLGLVLYHQDRYADAIRHFEMAVRQDEFNANRHANLGKAYMAMRQYAKAESAFKKALKLDPSELEYKDLLAEAIEKKQAHKAMLRK